MLDVKDFECATGSHSKPKEANFKEILLKNKQTMKRH